MPPKRKKPVIKRKISYNKKAKSKSDLALEKEDYKISGRNASKKKYSNKKTSSEQIVFDQQLLNSFIELIPDCIYFKDINSRFIKTNKANAIKLGFNNPEELIGKTDFDIFDEKNASEAIKDEQEITKTGRPFIGTEKKEIWKDGKATWAISHKMPTYDDKGNIIGTFGFTRDITIRKKAEIVSQALLRISEAAHTAIDMTTLYEKIHEVILTLMPAKNLYIAIYDDKTDLISFPYFKDEFDLVPAPRKSRKGVTEFIMRTDHAALINQKRLSELSATGEIELIGTLPMILLGAPLKVGGKTIGVIMVQDYESEKEYGDDEKEFLIFVTEQIAQAIERKRSADAIQRYTEELKELNNSKDKFFSIIAHDLRSPFNSLIGLSELLVNPNENLTEPERNEFVIDIHNLIKNVYELIQNLLEWAALQLGKIEYNPLKIELFDLVSKKIELLSMHADKKNISLVNEIKSNKNVLADKNMLGSLIQNFITNSIKFTNIGGTIKIDAALLNGSVVVNIEDNGIGMNKKKVDEILHLHSTKSSKGTSGEQGTGLGVILCKEMIERNGGKLNIISEPGLGTKVIFQIPAAI